MPRPGPHRTSRAAFPATSSWSAAG